MTHLLTFGFFRDGRQRALAGRRFANQCAFRPLVHRWPRTKAVDRHAGPIPQDGRYRAQYHDVEAGGLGPVPISRMLGNPLLSAPTFC